MLKFLAVLFGLLPACGLKNRLLSTLPNWQVDASARVSPVFLLGVERLRLGARCSLASGTLFRNLRALEMGDDTSIGPLNWIYASKGLQLHDDVHGGTFRAGPHSSITWRHRVDCSGGFFLGSMSVVAGQGSVILTHSVDFMSSEQRTSAISVGDYCFIGANCTVTAGVNVADRIVVGAGSVVVKDLDQSECLYAGNPARMRKELKGALYFHRSRGHIGP